MELKEWITTDSQGLDTRVELIDFGKADDLDPNLFVPPCMALQKSAVTAPGLWLFGISATLEPGDN